jgi:hypothetical protein
MNQQFISEILKKSMGDFEKLITLDLQRKNLENLEKAVAEKNF